MIPEAPTTTEQVALGNPSFVWRAGQDRRLDLIRRYVDLEGARVLDIGCGIGTYVKKLAEVSGDAFGVDIDPSRVREGEVGTLSVAGIECLPFAHPRFPMVLPHLVTTHLQDDL